VKALAALSSAAIGPAVAVIEWLIVWEWQTLNASDGTGWIALSKSD